MTRVAPLRSLLRPVPLGVLLLTLSVLILGGAFLEMRQSRTELIELMTRQSQTLLETLGVSAEASLLAGERIDQLIQERLLNNAWFIRHRLSEGRIDDAILRDIATANGIYRIHIYDPTGRKRHSSHQPVPRDLPDRFDPRERLQPLFDGAIDTLIIGVREARREAGHRFVVALATADRGAIVLNLDAAALLTLRRNIGLGRLLNAVAANRNLHYVAVQNHDGILAASGSVPGLDPIAASPFLQHALTDSATLHRFITRDSLEVFESVHPFHFRDRTVGLLRLGLSTAPLHAIEARGYRRLALWSGGLLFTAFILVGLIIAWQNLDLLGRRFREVETFSSRVLNHIGDAIVVVDAAERIQLCNAAAEPLFGVKTRDIVGVPLSALPGNPLAALVSATEHAPIPLSFSREGREMHLLATRSTYRGEDGQLQTVLVLRDTTRLRELEGQVQRKERLSAMGELASGVAHEIRNPLNTIATIVQQLDKDFEPERDREEYHELAGLVHQAVRRINRTIGEFLRFARPEPLRRTVFQPAQLFDQLALEFRPTLTKRNLTLTVDAPPALTVSWDDGKTRQVLDNLIRNAIDATPAGGHIHLALADGEPDSAELIVEDTGSGIPEGARSRIFNLYFTTKASGTGVGLSIVQRIVDEHGGTITVETPDEGGTRFRIRLPRALSADGDAFQPKPVS